MPRVGVRKTAREFMLTRPNSKNSAVVTVEENLLDKILQVEFTEDAQTILGVLYEDARAKETWFSRAKDTFKTENAFWHIQGVLSTAMWLVSAYFLVTVAAGAETIGANLPQGTLTTLGWFGLAAASYSFYALFTKVRARKRRAALVLFVVYLNQVFYLNLAGQGTTLLNITFASLAGVAVALFSEWSRPSK